MSIIYRIFSDYWVEFGFWVAFVPLIMVFFAIAIFVVPIKLCIKKSYDGWKFWSKYLLLLIAGMEVCAYIEEAYIRKYELNEKCIKELSPNKIYIGEVCKLADSTGTPGSHVWLRVYDAKTLELIKEGDGGYSWLEIFWDVDELKNVTAIYSNTTEDKYTMELPPSWLDKIRAKLP
jgi:hypothetical protein